MSYTMRKGRRPGGENVRGIYPWKCLDAIGVYPPTQDKKLVKLAACFNKTAAISQLVT